MKYEKTQIGWFIIILFSILIINLTIFYFMEVGRRPLPLVLYIILVSIFIFVLLIFYRLKIRVDNLGIHIIYGIGLVQININPEIIHEVKIAKIPWYFGLGIRITDKGMLYNIQGQHVVEISYLEGKIKTVQIGTHDARNLKRFIEDHSSHVS